jgi:hypothetical protein
MNPDPRCCGSGTCIIDADGRCWCGQQWDGHRMCAPTLPPLRPSAEEAALVAQPVGEQDGVQIVQRHAQA